MDLYRFRQRRFEPDERTALLLNMDGLLGPWLFDHSRHAAHPHVMRSPRIEPSDRRP